MSQLKKFLWLLSMALVLGLGFSFTGDKTMTYVHIGAGILLFGLCGFYSMLFLSRLIPGLNEWLIEREIVTGVAKKEVGYTGVALFVIVSCLSVYGLILAVTNVVLATSS